MLTILEKHQDPSGGTPAPLDRGDHRGQRDIELDVLTVHLPNHQLLILGGLRQISFLTGLPFEGANVGVGMREHFLQLVTLCLVDVDG